MLLLFRPKYLPDLVEAHQAASTCTLEIGFREEAATIGFPTKALAFAAL
jgi:hypothetical protein